MKETIERFIESNNDAKFTKLDIINMYNKITEDMDDIETQLSNYVQGKNSPVLNSIIEKLNPFLTPNSLELLNSFNPGKVDTEFLKVLDAVVKVLCRYTNFNNIKYIKAEAGILYNDEELGKVDDRRLVFVTVVNKQGIASIIPHISDNIFYSGRAIVSYKKAFDSDEVKPYFHPFNPYINMVNILLTFKEDTGLPLKPVEKIERALAEGKDIDKYPCLTAVDALTLLYTENFEKPKSRAEEILYALSHTDIENGIIPF